MVVLKEPVFGYELFSLIMCVKRTIVITIRYTYDKMKLPKINSKGFPSLGFSLSLIRQKVHLYITYKQHFLKMNKSHLFCVLKEKQVLK